MTNSGLNGLIWNNISNKHVTASGYESITWHTVIAAFNFCWLTCVFRCYSPFENPDFFAFISEPWVYRYYVCDTYTSIFKRRIQKQHWLKWCDSKYFLLLLQIATIPATIAASPSSNWTAAPMESYQQTKGICWMTLLRQTQMWWEEICCAQKVYSTLLDFCFISLKNPEEGDFAKEKKRFCWYL